MTHLEHVYDDIQEIEKELGVCLQQARKLALVVQEYESYATNIQHLLKYLKGNLGQHVSEQNKLMLELQKRKEPQPESASTSAGLMPWETKDPDKTLVMENGQVIGEKNHNTTGGKTDECPFN